MGQLNTQVTCLKRKTKRSASHRRPAAPPRPEAADLRSQAEDLLRDLALVYHLTQRVKQSILK
ncbi:MAG: hypothetical protein JO112_19295 [Planctomycetes bacterium]|nr:hypothetical protein [Planctomycetota bacterium]